MVPLRKKHNEPDYRTIGLVAGLTFGLTFFFVYSALTGWCH